MAEVVAAVVAEVAATAVAGVVVVAVGHADLVAAGHPLQLFDDWNLTNYLEYYKHLLLQT